MLSLMTNPSDMGRELAGRARLLRIELSWTQLELARRAGIALSTLRHFERTGRISLERLLMIASALRALEAFEGLLRLPRASSLAEIEARQTKRQRGRRGSR